MSERRFPPPWFIEDIGFAAVVLPLHQFMEATVPGLLCFRRRVGKDGRHTVRIDVESQEGQRFAAGISPLMHKAERLIDQGIGTPCLRRAVDCVGARSRDDVVKRRS